jgi:hypothetical protein
MTTQAPSHAPLTLTPEQERRIDEILGRYPTRRAACIPLLHVCQESVGWVSPDVIAFVAQRLGMSSSEVQGVVTFYTMYHQAPVGKHVLWVCRTAANIRGRGGAGFPMGVKWSFMPWPQAREAALPRHQRRRGRARHLQGPHDHGAQPARGVEGCIIGCFGIGAHTVYIYVRDELHLSKARLWGADREARQGLPRR